VRKPAAGVPMTECPSVELLRLLISQPSNHADAVGVMGHVVGCETCWKQMELLGVEQVRSPEPPVTAPSVGSWWRQNTNPTFVQANGAHASTAQPAENDRHVEPVKTAVPFIDLQPSNVAERLPLVPGYRIFGRIGRGGMGVVYRAIQLGLNRLV